MATGSLHGCRQRSSMQLTRICGLIHSAYLQPVYCSFFCSHGKGLSQETPSRHFHLLFEDTVVAQVVAIWSLHYGFRYLPTSMYSTYGAWSLIWSWSWCTEYVIEDSIFSSEDYLWLGDHVACCFFKGVRFPADQRDLFPVYIVCQPDLFPTFSKTKALVWLGYHEAWEA